MDKIAVVGIGRLGICLALNLEQKGFKVWGIDSNNDLINSLQQKTYLSHEPFVNDYLANAKHFHVSNSIQSIVQHNIRLVFIVVPTPSKNDGGFDHSAITEVANKLQTYQNEIHEPIHLVINSTTMPGFCDQLQQSLNPEKFIVCYNPEFIAQGSIIHDQQNPDQLLIGEENTESGDLLLEVYAKLCLNQPAICRMSRVSAEITKLATNCFLTTKIAFANAIGDIAKLSGGEENKILAAIGADSRIGNKYFKYGFGYGGPCFPRDNRAFTSYANSLNYQMNISDATDKANQAHAHFLFQDYHKTHQNDELLVFDSITYKKNTDIIEESQQLKLAIDLAKAGKKVKVIESSLVIAKLKDLYGNLFEYQIK